MGLFSGRHQPEPARNPRPKGAQSGTRVRNTSTAMFQNTNRARTPWLFPKSDRSVARTRKSMGG